MNSPITVWRNHKKLHAYLGRIGKILVWTKIYAAPSGFEHQAPYVVAVVEFDPSASFDKAQDKSSGQVEKIPLQVVDFEEEELKVSQKVLVVVRKGAKAHPDQVLEYCLKAKPI